MITTINTDYIIPTNIRNRIVELRHRIAEADCKNEAAAREHLESLTTGWIFKCPKYSESEIERKIARLKNHNWFDVWNYRYDHLKLPCTEALHTEVETLEEILVRLNRGVQISLSGEEYQVLDRVKHWRL